MEEMKPGLVYYISYGNTSVVGRYITSDVCNHYFNATLHNWNGHETFVGGTKGTYCVKAFIMEVRRATHPEIQSLIRQEIANGTI